MGTKNSKKGHFLQSVCKDLSVWDLYLSFTCFLHNFDTGLFSLFLISFLFFLMKIMVIFWPPPLHSRRNLIVQFFVLNSQKTYPTKEHLNVKKGSKGLKKWFKNVKTWKKPKSVGLEIDFFGDFWPFFGNFWHFLSFLFTYI